VPLDASKNSLVLPILGLLLERPAHAYDVTARLRERYGLLTVTRSTVTTLLKSLANAGLVAPEAPDRVGNRPPRQAYALTDAGVASFREKVRSGLREAPVASVDFVLAVAYVGVLPAEDAASILADRSDRVQRQRTTLRAQPGGGPEIHMLEVAYWSAIAAAEIDWINTLVARIRSRDIDWSGAQPDGHEKG
jgi:DNA-binding PadR family transcriptional regulator